MNYLYCHYVEGPREEYLRIGVPLYEASIRCDWKEAKAILDEHPELVRCSITENGETPLHIAASVKINSKQVEQFVKKLVDMMTKDDLELQNQNHNTAFYLAASGGNIKTVMFMLEKNRILARIPGANGMMMPLYAAAMFKNYEVVKYLYENSHDLRDDGWTTENRGWLVEKCVEGDMFDVALRIVKIYPQLGSGRVLTLLALKPEAFSETNSNKIKRNINSGKHELMMIVPLQVTKYVFNCFTDITKYDVYKFQEI
ncbi:putative ankyrin repeat-containing domain-containing protein [Helianthus anomalus]